MESESNHDLSGSKSLSPPFPSLFSSTLFTSERSNMDYFTLAGVCKRTGATEDELAVFEIKEIVDNAIDFSEVNFSSSSNENPEIFVDVVYEKERNYFAIKIRNSSFGLKDLGFTEKRIHAIFDDLERFHSSKRNLFKVNRGLQGDAMKEIVGIPKALGVKYNGKEWNEPLIIRNGAGEKFEIRSVIDKIRGSNYCTVVKKAEGTNDNLIEVEVRLPNYGNVIDLTHIMLILIKYALLNTHITFHFNAVTSTTDNRHWNVILPATQKLSIEYTNSKRLTSIYWTDLATFENLFYGIEDKSAVLYDILRNHFREGTLLKKEDDLLISVGQFQKLPKQESEEKIRNMFLRLRATMKPPTDPSVLKRDLLPFSIKSREQALFARVSQLGYNPKDLKYKAKIGYYYSDNYDHKSDIAKNTSDTCVPYIIEVAVIHTYNLPYYLLYCEGINASPNHYHSFSDGYSLEWTTKSGSKKQAYGIRGLLKESGYSYRDGKSEKERSIVLVNLWCPKLQYTDYGKSNIDLSPFYGDLVNLLSKMCSSSNKRRDDDGNKLEAKALFTEYLIEERYKKVLMEPYIKNTDSWNTSTPVYRFRPELERLGIHVERKYLQSLVKTICDEMPELKFVSSQFVKTGKIGVKREALGIYEAPRAHIYFRGHVYDVSFKQLEVIKKIATFILIIEKEGVVELLTYWADKFGFALCYTKGFLTDNAKEFSELAIKEGSRMAILTDNDFSGWVMAREVPRITRIGVRIATLERLNVPVDEVVENLPKPKGSEKKVNEDYHANNHATAAEQMHDEGLIPEEDWELLTGGKYGRRIEIDNVIAYVGAERFWNEFILPSFANSFVDVDYNLSLKGIEYVVLPPLKTLNELTQKRGISAATEAVQNANSEYANYDVSSQGFISDITKEEQEIEKRVLEKELEDKHLRWLSGKLESLNKEFIKRTGIVLDLENEEENTKDHIIVNPNTDMGFDDVDNIKS
jgi:hypothetical protein